MNELLSTDACIEQAMDIARIIDDHKGENTLVLDVHELCSWTECFIITTIRSQGHLKGVLRHISEYLQKEGIQISGKQKNLSDDGWMLIDCGSVVIHLMDQEKREFYELEKLWFSAPSCYQSSKSS
ncbi:MAG: ribosome silencing factor [Spirochaetales bacterium]|nr:ribosome silencing factor [Spirochaetales bacterium]